MSHLLRRRRLIHPPGSLRSRAFLWLDPRYHKDGREYLEDISGSGAVHDAVLGSTGGSDAEDPDFFPWTGMNYLKFPSTAGNNAKITLAVATTYDYTITYDGGSTDTGTQVSDGSGVLTFAGDDAKFTNLNVRRIAVEPDGGGALVADLNFALSFATEQVSAGSITLARTSSAAKLVEVTRPGFLLHTDDYFEIADHADLDFRLADSFTVMILLRLHTDAAAMTFISKKIGQGNVTGWQLVRSATPVPVFRTSDGSNSAVDGVSDFDNGNMTLFAGVRRAGVDETEAYVNGLGTGSPGSGLLGTMENNDVLRIGRDSGAGSVYSNMEFYGAALFREALSQADIIRLQAEFGVPL